jgi:serine protease Do
MSLVRSGRLVPSGLLAGALAAALALPGAAAARGAPDSFADLAARLLPAVVNISSTSNGGGPANAQRGPDVPAFPPGSPFEQFFHDFMNRHHPGGGTDQGQNDPDGQDDEDNGGQGTPPDGAPPPHHTQSLGSGFIVDPSGIVVTNNHVIDGADEITVTLQDNTVLKAKLLGHDDKADLAVLKIEPKHPLAAVKWGNSDASRVGDWVLAIGNPFGLGGTVTAGIVSARGRDIQQGPYDDFIQTDAPINRGNSGGPLFNMDGEVVGINTAIYSPSGGSIGIGFAIPSDEAHHIVDQLRSFGHTRRGWIGVRIQQVTPDIAESLNLPKAEGALVAGVNAGGPAEHAHLQNGDVILSFNNTKLEQMKTLPRVVADTSIDAMVPVTVWRAGHQVTLQIRVAEMPDDTPPDEKKPAPAAAASSLDLSDLGMKLSPLSDALRQKFHIDAGQKGLVVTDVAKGGVAEDRGVKPGDVLMEVQQQAVSSTSDVQKRLAEARSQNRHTVLLLVQGADGMRWIPVPVGRKPG